MTTSVASHERRRCPYIVFENLPNVAQSRVLSAACTPACPAHVLLALVSKTWAAEGARHLQLDGASIELELTSSTDSPSEQQEKEAGRLQGLAQWLQQYGVLVHKLHVSANLPPGRNADVRYQLDASQRVPEVIAALTAASQASSGLRLQQLQLPALPGTPISTLCGMLPGCHQLRELRLCNSYSDGTTTTTRQDVVGLAAALQQLTQLTLLQLEEGLLLYDGGLEEHDISDLVGSLPSRLEVLDLEGDPDWGGPYVRLCTNSLEGLVSLRQLALPGDTFVFQSCASGGGSITCGCEKASSSSSDPLACLTALTSIHCWGGQRECHTLPLLALPNLVQLTAGLVAPGGLEVLSSMAPLRSLDICLNPSQHQELSKALQQLTQLTDLSVFVYEPESHADGMISDEDEARLQEAVAGWARVVSALTGLHGLSVEPLLLKEINLRPLTALTALDVDCKWSPCWHTQERLDVLLRKLAPARGRLLSVLLQAVPEALHEGCKAAVASALGDGAVTVFT